MVMSMFSDVLLGHGPSRFLTWWMVVFHRHLRLQPGRRAQSTFHSSSTARRSHLRPPLSSLQLFGPLSGATSSRLSNQPGTNSCPTRAKGLSCPISHDGPRGIVRGDAARFIPLSPPNIMEQAYRQAVVTPPCIKVYAAHDDVNSAATYFFTRVCPPGTPAQSPIVRDGRSVVPSVE